MENEVVLGRSMDFSRGPHCDLSSDTVDLTFIYERN